MSNLSGISQIFERCISGIATEEDRLSFWKWAETPGNEEEAREMIGQAFPLAGHRVNIDADTFEFMMEAILNADKDLLISTTNRKPEPVIPPPVARRVHFLRTAWFRYAAAIILLAGVSCYLYFRPAAPALSPQDSGIVAASARDIAPGTNRAVLTVNNRAIDLAANKNGIAINNTIAYTDGEKILPASETRLLQLTTPKGGQYQVVLPDGTKVWLNAASSISFPSVFNGETRQIKVTGEVYLEVSENKTKPFYVDIDGKSTVQVLGTSFNINSYGDAGDIKTTLIEGSVRVFPFNTTAVAASSAGQLNAQAVVLRPGQQAIQPLNDGKAMITVLSDIDPSQALAWKNGLFNFNGLSVREGLNQLARWYDIEIQIQGNEPEFHFGGKMYRSATLSEVLKTLQKMEIKFRMEGKTLIFL